MFNFVRSMLKTTKLEHNQAMETNKLQAYQHTHIQNVTNLNR